MLNLFSGCPQKSVGLARFCAADAGEPALVVRRTPPSAPAHHEGSTTASRVDLMVSSERSSRPSNHEGVGRDRSDLAGGEGFTHYGLDLEAVGIEDKAAIEAGGVLGADAWRAGVAAAEFQRGFVEGVDFGAVPCAEADVEADARCGVAGFAGMNPEGRRGDVVRAPANG